MSAGFGAGSMLRRFLDDGASVAGVDPDQLGIDVDERVRAEGDLRTGGIEDVSRLPGDQDLVYGIHVLEHVTDPHAALRSSLELLRPGGRASFITPAGDSSGVDRYGAAWWMLEDPTHIRFFTADSLARAAERMLAGAVGASSARRVIAAALAGGGRAPEDVVRIDVPVTVLAWIVWAGIVTSNS